MKIKSVLTTLIFGLINSVLVNFAVTQKVFAQTSDEISQLREAGVPVIMPSYTFQSFQLTNFTIHKSGGGEPYYKATYQGANRCLFSINGSKAGWGDNLTIIRTWVFNTELLGKVTLMEMVSVGDQTELQVWLQPRRGTKPIIEGFPYATYLLIFTCQNNLFPPQEAIKIIQSFKIQNP